MSVTAVIILIITAIQSNGNLSYTLSVFKTKHFLKSTQLVTRSEKLVATVLKIHQQSEITKPTGRAKWYAHTLHKKKSSCAGKTNANAKDKISCARAGVNEVRMCRSKCEARAQAKMRCACAAPNEVRMRRQKKDAHAQAKMRCACDGLNEVCIRRKKWNAHEQVKMKCACASQHKMRTRKPKRVAHAQF